MQQVNIHEAKTNLSQLLSQVMLGEEITIAKAGKPIARLAPLKTTNKKRVLGTERDKFTIPVDFDAPLPPDVLSSFEGET